MVKVVAIIGGVLLTLIALTESTSFTLRAILVIAVLPIVAVAAVGMLSRSPAAVTIVTAAGAIASLFTGVMTFTSLNPKHGSFLGVRPEGSTTLFQGVALPILLVLAGIGGCIFVGFLLAFRGDDGSD